MGQPGQSDQPITSNNHILFVFFCLRLKSLSSPTSAVRLASGAGYKGLTGHSQRKRKYIVGRPANCGGGWKSKGTPQNKTMSNFSGPNKAKHRRGQTHLSRILKSMSQCLIFLKLSNGFRSVLKSSNFERCGGLKHRKASKQILCRCKNCLIQILSTTPEETKKAGCC